MLHARDILLLTASALVFASVSASVSPASSAFVAFFSAAHTRACVQGITALA